MTSTGQKQIFYTLKPLANLFSPPQLFFHCIQAPGDKTEPLPKLIKKIKKKTEISVDHQALTQRLQIARKMHLVQMKHKDWSYYRQPRLQCFGEFTEDVSTSKISFFSYYLKYLFPTSPSALRKATLLEFRQTLRVLKNCLGSQSSRSWQSCDVMINSGCPKGTTSTRVY